jgi:15-cis-phytoene synthase
MKLVRNKLAAPNCWRISDWSRLEKRLRKAGLSAGSEAAAWRVLTKSARAVMREYTTSFFIVSRFLPAAKRKEVEAIYAAVRYPDEIVDTFDLTNLERQKLLYQWEAGYEDGLASSSLKDALHSGVPCFLAAFTKVVRERGIPAEYYRSFLTAMRRDISPSPFKTLDELIDDYIYGSAVVVGFFLTYVYGSRTATDFSRALESARALGIALQLTNFLRDVAEDQRRGRVYLPQVMLQDAGIKEINTMDKDQQQALGTVLRRLASIANDYYVRANADLDAFNPDCRIAIHACIRVYGRLNERIAQNHLGINHRESVPFREKFEVLPPSKYWRIPIAYFIG